jgi:hypothetical protein
VVERENFGSGLCHAPPHLSELVRGPSLSTNPTRSSVSALDPATLAPGGGSDSSKRHGPGWRSSIPGGIGTVGTAHHDQTSHPATADPRRSHLRSQPRRDSIPKSRSTLPSVFVKSNALP